MTINSHEEYQKALARFREIFFAEPASNAFAEHEELKAALISYEATHFPIKRPSPKAVKAAYERLSNS